MDISKIPFVPSPFFTPANDREIDLVVIHTMEAPEKGTTAEAVARYFQTPNLKVSSHYCIDADSIVQCVELANVAWCAPGTNHNGIQLEHAGYARQTAADWVDAYSLAMLDLSAQLTAELCKEYDIPVEYIDRDGLRAGERGITTHWQASLAFGRSNHTDPGPNFPMDWYLSRVGKHMVDTTAKPWPIPIPKWFWAWAEWRLKGKTYPRPSDAPYFIPAWAWRRLAALINARKEL